MEQNQDHEIIYVKNESYVHIFPADIEVVWNFMKDTNKTYEALKDVRTPATYTKGEKSYELGAKFHFIWKNYRKLLLETVELAETEEYKKIVFMVENEPTENNYLFIYNLHKISIDNSTLLKWEFIYLQEKGIKIRKSHHEKLMSERKEMLKKFEVYVNTHYNRRVVSNSIFLKCKLKYLWKILSNWKNFKKLVPEICEDLLLDEHADYKKPGFTFYIKFNSSLKCKAVVSRAEYIEDSDFQYHILLFKIQNSKIINKEILRQKEQPFQEIQFKVKYLTEEVSFIDYNIQVLDMSEDVNIIRDYSYTILKRLKKSIKKLFEKKKEESNQHEAVSGSKVAGVQNKSQQGLKI